MTKLSIKTGPAPRKFSEATKRGRATQPNGAAHPNGPTEMVRRLISGEGDYILSSPIKKSDERHRLQSAINTAARNMGKKVKTHTDARQRLVATLV